MLFLDWNLRTLLLAMVVVCVCVCESEIHRWSLPCCEPPLLFLVRSVWLFHCTVGLLMWEVCSVAHMSFAMSPTRRSGAWQPRRDQLLVITCCGALDLHHHESICLVCDIACSLVPCLGHHLAFLKCVPIHDSLAHTLQIPSLDDKCYPHPPSWHCLRLCRHLFHVQTCTHLCETIATCNIHFLFRSVSYTWQRLICPKRHKSKYPSCLFDHRLTKKLANISQQIPWIIIQCRGQRVTGK